MKNWKNLEKVLNKRGYDLEWDKYGYFNCVPFATKDNVNLALCYNTENAIYRNYSIATVLNLNFTKKQINDILDNFEEYVKKCNKKGYTKEFYNNENLGSITYYKHKTIFYNRFIEEA